MEVKRHNNMKTVRRKMSQTMVKDTKPKDKAKGSTEAGKKKMTTKLRLKNEMELKQHKI